MQKLINVLAVASSVVSLAVVGSGVYVYVNRDSIVDGVKSQVMEAVTGSLGASIPGLGSNDLMPSLPQASQSPLPVGENAAAGGPVGFGIPNF